MNHILYAHALGPFLLAQSQSFVTCMHACMLLIILIIYLAICLLHGSYHPVVDKSDTPLIFSVLITIKALCMHMHDNNYMIQTSPCL